MFWNLNKKKGRFKSDLEEKKWWGLQLVILSMYVNIDNINKFSLSNACIHITHRAISSDDETTNRTHMYESLRVLRNVNESLTPRIYSDNSRRLWQNIEVASKIACPQLNHLQCIDKLSYYTLLTIEFSQSLRNSYIYYISIKISWNKHMCMSVIFDKKTKKDFINLHTYFCIAGRHYFFIVR